jgi:hypothetical protein
MVAGCNGGPTPGADLVDLLVLGAPGGNDPVCLQLAVHPRPHAVARLQVRDVLRPVRAGHQCFGNHAAIVAAGPDTIPQAYDSRADSPGLGREVV